MQFQKSNHVLIQCLLIVLLCFTVYGFSFRNGFVWDDNVYLYENRLVEEPEGLTGIWFTREAVQYYPVVFTTFWIEHKLWGFRPAGYHIVNVVLHCLNALLLFFIVRKLYARVVLFVAVLFAIHPIQVETVAWITERKNLLALLFFLLATVTYLRFDRTRKAWHYLLTVGLFCLAILSKSIAVCFAWVPLLLAWWKHGAVTRREIALVIPLMTIGLLGAVNTINLEYRAGAHGAAWVFTFWERCLLAGRTVFFYLYKLCVPFEFMFFYPQWELDVMQWWQWFFPLAVLLVLGILLYFRHRIGRGAAGLFLFYLISIFPALGFINVYPMKFSFVADHFCYLSTPCLLLLIGTALVFVLDILRVKFPIFRQSPAKIFGWGIMAVMVIYLCGTSKTLTRSYRDEVAFWEDLLRKNPQSAIAYNNLANIYNDSGEYRKAVTLYKKAIELMPEWAECYNNYATACNRSADYETAKELCRKAIVLRPEYAEAYNNYGRACKNSGDHGIAMALYRKAIEISPTYAQPYYNLGNIYNERGDYQTALVWYEKAIRLDPDAPQSYNNCASVYYHLGDYNAAITAYKKALEIVPDFATTHYNLAVIYYYQKDYELAIHHFDRARECGYSGDPELSKRLEVFRRKSVPVSERK